MRERFRSLRPGTLDLIVLPENANVPGLGDPARWKHFARKPGAEFIEMVAATARRLRSRIVVGVICRDGRRWFNRTLLFDRRGVPVFAYDKTHLTDVETRDCGFSPGAKEGVYEMGGLRLGFAVCFDFYFPEYFARLAAHHVNLILCPSYQRSESAERIRFICQCRALDSGAFLVRSSYAMGTPDRGGHSMIVGPDGTVLADAGEAPGVIAAQIDPKAKFVKPASHGQPVEEHWQLMERHRRPELYRLRSEREGVIPGAPFPPICAAPTRRGSAGPAK